MQVHCCKSIVSYRILLLPLLGIVASNVCRIRCDIDSNVTLQFVHMRSSSSTVLYACMFEAQYFSKVRWPLQYLLGQNQFRYSEPMNT
jgi:hypothetical protein